MDCYSVNSAKMVSPAGGVLTEFDYSQVGKFYKLQPLTKGKIWELNNTKALNR